MKQSKLIVNVKSGAPFDQYVGRKPSESTRPHWGNPFSHNAAWGIKVASVAASITAYHEWLTGKAHLEVEPKRRQWIVNNVHTLKGKTLGCFCSPGRCHAEVLVHYANRELKATVGPNAGNGSSYTDAEIAAMAAARPRKEKV